MSVACLNGRYGLGTAVRTTSPLPPSWAGISRLVNLAATPPARVASGQSHPSLDNGDPRQTY